MNIGYIRGHEIYEDDLGVWRYSDTFEPYLFKEERPCIFCKKAPTPEGYDACLGKIEGAFAACCGHGIHDGYIKW